MTPRMTTPTDRPSAPPPDRPPGRRPVPATTGKDQPDDGDRGQHVEPRENGSNVTHVRLFALVEHRLTGDRDIEHRRTDDQVVQDRVRSRSQVGRGEAGPRGRLGPVLLEPDPSRRQERQDRDRDDDDRRRDADQEAGEANSGCTHAVILAVPPGKPVGTPLGDTCPTTRPRASSPGPTNPPSGDRSAAPCRARARPCGSVPGTRQGRDPGCRADPRSRTG